MKLTRRTTFSSGHRYWRTDLSPEQNRALFGKWASPYNHGHNYVLDVSFTGRIDPASGMVINIKTLDRKIKENVIALVDQKSLSDEVDFFGTNPSSTENVVRFVEEKLGELPEGVVLSSIRVYETPLLFAEKGDGSEMNLTRVYEFSASHRLNVPAMSHEENIELFGKCNNPAGHGHNYILEVTVSGVLNKETGMITDIEVLDEAVRREVVDRYDHKHLNEDILEFRGTNPTTEVLTKTIWERLSASLPAKLKRVVVRETARNFFEYSGEDE
jgi:6-pyruvoyltetrahydropterin/6-carboxytetrahydropterin synthase